MQGAYFNVVILPVGTNPPPAKLADVELHFTAPPLVGVKLGGFAVWRSRLGHLNVTVPARQYTVNGERRAFGLLRPISEAAALEPLLDLIKAAYEDWAAEREINARER